MKAARAKLFRGGGSQAVRHSRECRFPTRVDGMRREGRRVILEAADKWSAEFRACLGAWRGKIPRPKQKPVRALRDPFA